MATFLVTDLDGSQGFLCVQVWLRQLWGPKRASTASPIASASMLTKLLRGMSVEEARKFRQAFKDWITVRDPEPSPVDLDELEALGGVRNYPVRIKCALLPWETFEGALRKQSPN